MITGLLVNLTTWDGDKTMWSSTTRRLEHLTMFRPSSSFLMFVSFTPEPLE